MSDETTQTDEQSAAADRAVGRAAASSAAPEHEVVRWNPYNKVVQDHRDGTVWQEMTDAARARRGLPTPWNSGIAAREMYEAPIY